MRPSPPPSPTFCSCSSLYWRHSFLPPLPLLAGLCPAIQSNHSRAASCTQQCNPHDHTRSETLSGRTNRLCHALMTNEWVKADFASDWVQTKHTDGS